MNKSGIEYRCKDYLSLDYFDEFDVATLIYYDYAVLSHADIIALPKKVCSSLNKGGKLIFDVFKMPA